MLSPSFSSTTRQDGLPMNSTTNASILSSKCVASKTVTCLQEERALILVIGSISGCYKVASSVIVIWDTLITFNRELTCFWSTESSGASLLFFANRWISMAINILELVDFSPLLSNKSCSVFISVGYALQILQDAPPAVFSALRAYVLSRSKPFGLLVLTLSLAPLCTNLARYGYHVSGTSMVPFGCSETDLTTGELNIRHLNARDTFKNIRQSCRFNTRLPLSDVFFRDGMIYFVVLVVLNLLHLILSVTVLSELDKGTAQVTQFTSNITGVLVSHFLLELQEANRMIIRVGADDPLHASRDPYDDTPSFISSLGAFIDLDSPTSLNGDSDIQEVLGSSEEEGGMAQTPVSSSLV